PPRPRPSLHRHGRLVGEDHRDAFGGGCSGDGEICLPMGHLEDTDRRQQERTGEVPAEQLDRGVSLGDVTQDAQDDPKSIERGAVGAHRPLETGTSGDVGESLRRHSAPGAFLQLRRIEWDAASPTAQRSDVDVGLALPTDAELAHRPPRSTCTRSPMNNFCMGSQGKKITTLNSTRSPEASKSSQSCSCVPVTSASSTTPCGPTTMSVSWQSMSGQ